MGAREPTPRRPSAFDAAPVRPFLRRQRTRVIGSHDIYATHPHVGGEHAGAYTEVGKLWRFIPAWAGNTATIPRRPWDRTVHPRVGGEHGIERGDRRGADGSSPRERGTRTGGWCWCAARPVHPRVSGEHISPRCKVLRKGGSSPRERGTRKARGAGAGVQRFIPAWAGNTPTRCRPMTIVSVHPRVGGEHGLEPWVAPAPNGSSPRGRGTPSACRRTSLALRFIPAWAGNTRARSAMY